jgi:hypothetical protein
MNETAGQRVHWSFWAIAAVAFVWNIMGASNFVVQMTADSLAAYPEAYHPIIENRPGWATAAFAMAVFGGVLGCLLLLVRRSTANYLFVPSLFGVIVTMIHMFGVSGVSPFEIWIGVLMQLIVAVLLIWYTRYAQDKQWITSGRFVTNDT